MARSFLAVGIIVMPKDAGKYGECRTGQGRKIAGRGRGCQLSLGGRDYAASGLIAS